MGLQLFVRHSADVAIIDVHGKATIGPANDILRNQLRRLIEGGTSKVLVNLTDATQLDSSSIGTIVSAFISLKRQGANLKLLRGGRLQITSGQFERDDEHYGRQQRDERERDSDVHQPLRRGEAGVWLDSRR